MTISRLLTPALVLIAVIIGVLLGAILIPLSCMMHKSQSAVMQS